MTEFPLTLNPDPKAPPPDASLKFGTVFTDHMFVMNYAAGRGWFDPRIEPYHALPLDPATCVLHYAQAVFDGLKAFRGADGKIRLFRPDRHAARLNRSCARLCIPALDPALVERSFRALVEVDQRWVPKLPGTALYIRPTVIATEPFLGVRPSETYLYYVILSPVGAYYPEGINPVKILATGEHVRALPGGLGAAKTAANYAASLYPAEEAHRLGFTQVLYLDGAEHRFLEEVGTMNIMLKIGEEVITPPLGGSILAGITRESVLALLGDWGIKVVERPISIEEVIAAITAGTLSEMWGTGTAAVISPVGELGYQGARYPISGGRIGALTERLYDAIVGIQYGTAPDPRGWAKPLALPEPALA
uniref:Probable branched-chain-amino-acid aminotransferase n=1 Tax=Acidicaldus sp. TaxID=1872105 RepID=A0A8J4M4X6_9PROT